MKYCILFLLFIFIFNNPIYSFDKKEVIDTLEDSVSFLDEEITLPDDSFFGKDKDDVKDEIDEFLDELFVMHVEVEKFMNMIQSVSARLHQ